MLAFVVTKKIRDGLRMFSGDEFRAGCDMAGAKAHLLCWGSVGTTEVVPCYKAFCVGFIYRPEVVPCFKAFSINARF